MENPKRAPRARQGAFAPIYVHRAFGMGLVWAAALERARRPDGRRLPGSARRVMDLILGAEAMGKGTVTQLGLVRLSQGAMPRASIQDGLRALEECGIVARSPRGWNLVLAQAQRPAPPRRKSATGNGEVPSPVNPLKAPRVAGQGGARERKPTKAALWAKALREAGFSSGGSWSIARKIRQEFHPGAVEEATRMAKARPHRGDFHGLAGWILTEEWDAVVRRLKARRRRPAAGSLEGALAALRVLESLAPSVDAPGYLDHLGEIRVVRRRAVAAAESQFPDVALALRMELESALANEGVPPDGPLRARVWEHRWTAELLARVSGPQG